MEQVLNEHLPRHKERYDKYVHELERTIREIDLGSIKEKRYPHRQVREVFLVSDNDKRLDDQDKQNLKEPYEIVFNFDSKPYISGQELDQKAANGEEDAVSEEDFASDYQMFHPDRKVFQSFYEQYMEVQKDLAGVPTRQIGEDRQRELLINLDKKRADNHNEAAAFVMQYFDQNLDIVISPDNKNAAARKLFELFYHVWQHQLPGSIIFDNWGVDFSELHKRVFDEVGIDIEQGDYVTYGFHENDPRTQDEILFTGANSEEKKQIESILFSMNARS